MGGLEKPICRGRGLGQFVDLRELGKKEEVVFLRGFDTPMPTMVIYG